MKAATARRLQHNGIFRIFILVFSHLVNNSTVSDPWLGVENCSILTDIGLKQQLSQIYNSSLNTTHSARNLGVTFDENLTFSDQISSLSKSCYSHIRELRRICSYLDSKTASTIAASIVHSKLDYCNSLYYNLPKSQK